MFHRKQRNLERQFLGKKFLVCTEKSQGVGTVRAISAETQEAVIKITGNWHGQSAFYWTVPISLLSIAAGGQQ